MLFFLGSPVGKYCASHGVKLDDRAVDGCQSCPESCIKKRSGTVDSGNDAGSLFTQSLLLNMFWNLGDAPELPDCLTDPQQCQTSPPALHKGDVKWWSQSTLTVQGLPRISESIVFS